MANTLKKKLKKCGRQIGQLFKDSILITVMYACAGSILMMLIGKGEKIVWDGGAIAWTVVCLLGGAAYQAVASWAIGGSAYEMLVTGNIRRSATDAYGNEYKISSHKEAKEYRPWKGFAIGAFVGILPLIFAVILGCNQEIFHGSENPPKWLGIVYLIGVFVSGWTVVPFSCMNEAGISVSYFWSLPLLLLPVIVSGAFYIAGAYGKRNKALRLQKLEEEAEAARLANQKEKKINYGGLPGTKPKKRK